MNATSVVLTDQFRALFLLQNCPHEKDCKRLDEMTSEIFQINVVQVLKSLRIFLNKYNGRMRDRAILYYARLLNLRL